MQIMAERRLDLDRPKLVREMTRQLSYTLRCHRDKGMVASERGNGNVAGVAARWQLWSVRAVCLRRDRSDSLAIFVVRHAWDAQIRISVSNRQTHIVFIGIYATSTLLASRRQSVIAAAGFDVSFLAG